MDTQTPKPTMAIPRKAADARRTRRTTFRLPARSHRCIGTLAAFYNLTDKDFIDMLVCDDNPIVRQIMDSSDSETLLKVEAGAVDAAGVRKTYVVTARVIEALEDGARARGCTRDTYLQSLLTIFRALVLSDARERIARWEEAKSRLASAVTNGFAEEVAAVHALTEDMDWPDGQEPKALLSTLCDGTIARMEANLQGCRHIVQQLEKAPASSAGNAAQAVEAGKGVSGGS